MDNKNIFLYVPNLIGYGRLILLAAAFFYMETDPVFFLGFYCSSIILDGFDGYAARKLDQVTTFGAWLDVVIDNLSRAMLWTYIANMLVLLCFYSNEGLASWGWLVSCLEWIVFVCTHTLGKQWKSAEQSVPPIWVQAVMANGFKTPIGTFVILGLHCLPIWLYLQKNELLDNVFTPCVQAYFTIALSTGRLLCMTVEFWFIYNHIQTMAAWDDRPPTPTPTPTPKLDCDDDDDDEYDDGVACDTGDDNIVAEEVKPIVTKPRSEMVVRRVRNKGPSIQPTPGSTIINMGATPQGRRGSSQDKRGSSQDRRGSSLESPPMRRQPIDEPLHKRRRSPGPLRRRPDPERERPYPPRGRPRGRRPEYMPPYPPDQRPRPPGGSPGGRRRPPRDYGPVDSEGRRRQSPRRLEIDGRIPRPPDGVRRRRRRSESPSRLPPDNIERRRRRSESPGGRRRLRPMKDPVEREPPELIDGRSLSVMRSSYLEKLQSGNNVRLDVQTKPDNTDKDKSREDTQVKVKEHDQEEPANTSLSSQQIIQGDGGVKSTLSSQPQSLVAESSLKLKDDKEGESKSVTSATVETVKPLDSPRIDEQLPDEDGETSPDQGASPSTRRKKRQSVFGKLVRKPKPQVIDDTETGSIGVEGDDNVEHTHSLVKQPARKKRITFSKKKSEKQNDLEETGSVDVNNNQIDEATSHQSTTSPRQKRKSIFKRKKDKRQNEEGEASEGMQVSKTTSRDDKDDTQSTEGNDTSKQQMTARSGSPSIEIEENKTEIATL